MLVRLKQKLGIDTLVPVHRIDRDTAGLVMFSVRPDTRAAYHALFSQRTVKNLQRWRGALTWCCRLRGAAAW